MSMKTVNNDILVEWEDTEAATEDAMATEATTRDK